MIAEHMSRLEAGEEPIAVSGFDAQYKAHMAKLGAKGGRKGGKRRLQTLTQEQRSEIALKAARARWAKVAKKR